MRILQRTLISIAMVSGLSIGAYAQKEGKKPPPKDPPPVVTPQPKGPPQQRPPYDGKKPKKPNGILFWKSEDED